jgi:chemotaxis protein MotB
VMPSQRPLSVSMVLVAATLSAGCVSKVTYDRLAAEAGRARVDAEAKQKEADGRLQALQSELAAAETATQDREARLSDLSTVSHNVQAQLDEQTAMNEQLRVELGRLGRDVDKILAERGTLSKALEDAKARLEELRRAQAASEARVAVFRDFERRFKPLIDVGQLRVETRRGQVLLAIPGDTLFEPGRAEVRAAASKGVLLELARTLELSSSPATGRRYLVTAHVDSTAEQPVADARVEARPRQRAMSARVAEARKPPRPRTPWELSVAQAVAVVEYLASLGVAPASLTAAGAGSFDPVAPGDDADARTKNRRVEIALLPAPDEPPSAPAK